MTDTQSQSFKAKLESFLIVLFRCLSKEIKYGGSQLLAGCAFSASNTLCLKTKEQKNVTRGLGEENRAGVLEQRALVHYETTSDFHPCDFRYYHELMHASVFEPSSLFFLVKPCIH